MKIIKTIANLKKNIFKTKNLGFVPTLGNLHQGHISLIKKSTSHCSKTLVTIYVNPTQFNNKKDFINYPRNINKDLKILKKCKVDYVFLPKTSEIYKKRSFNKLLIHRNKKILCGKYREGHFEGVINIIDRFLRLINPDFMFLGEKDFQQLFLIKHYVKKRFKVKIIQCKTIRNKSNVIENLCISIVLEYTVQQLSFLLLTFYERYFSSFYSCRSPYSLIENF